MNYKDNWKGVGAGYKTSSGKMIKLSLHLPQLKECDRPAKVYFWISDLEVFLNGGRDNLPVFQYHDIWRGKEQKKNEE